MYKLFLCALFPAFKEQSFRIRKAEISKEVDLQKKKFTIIQRIRNLFRLSKVHQFSMELRFQIVTSSRGFLLLGQQYTIVDNDYFFFSPFCFFTYTSILNLLTLLDRLKKYRVSVEYIIPSLVH